MDNQTPQQPQGTITDLSGLLDRLLTNDHIPESIRDEYWVLFSNTTKLANLSDEDIKWLMNQFDLLEIRTIRSLPGHEYDITFAGLMTALKMEYYSNLNRAKNGFERENQVKQISMQYASPMPQDSVHSTGYLAQFKKLINWGK